MAYRQGAFFCSSRVEGFRRGQHARPSGLHLKNAAPSGWNHLKLKLRGQIRLLQSPFSGLTLQFPAFAVGLGHVLVGLWAIDSSPGGAIILEFLAHPVGH
jgi:hypothetical protein